MARAEYDGVVEAVHYTPEGQVAWVRVYQRRGPTFSDRVLLDRMALVELLKAGERFVVGERIPYLSSTFKVGQPLRLVVKDGVEILATGEAHAIRDHLEGVPLV